MGCWGWGCTHAKGSSRRGREQLGPSEGLGTPTRWVIPPGIKRLHITFDRERTRAAANQRPCTKPGLPPQNCGETTHRRLAYSGKERSGSALMPWPVGLPTRSKLARQAGGGQQGRKCCLLLQPPPHSLQDLNAVTGRSRLSLGGVSVRRGE